MGKGFLRGLQKFAVVGLRQGKSVAGLEKIWRTKIAGGHVRGKSVVSLLGGLLQAAGFNDRCSGESVLVAGGDEGEEERVGLEGLGFELGVELAADEEWVGGDLDDFDVSGVGGCAGEAEAAAGEDGLVLAVELVA